MTRKQWIIFGIVIFSALLLRSLILYDLFSQGPGKLIEDDSVTYQDPAKALLEHGWFARDPAHPNTPMFIRTPGYPAFLAASYILFGKNWLAALILQIIASTGTVAITYFMARRIWGHSSGIAAAIFVAIDTNQIYYSTIFLSETLFTFFLMLMCLGMVNFITDRKHQMRWALILGLALALATLVRPVSYYLFFFILIGFLIKHKTFFVTMKQLAMCLVLTIIPFVILVGGWQIRNKEVVGTYAYSGIEEIIMINYRANATLMLAEGISEQEAFKRIQAMLPDLSHSSLAESRKAKMGLGVRIILSHPIEYIRVAASGALRFMAGPGESAILRMMGLDRPNTGPFYDMIYQPSKTFMKKWISGNPMVLIVVTGALFLLFIQYVAVGIAVIDGISKPAIDPIIHIFLGCIFVYFLLISSGIETYSRFRVPVAPILMSYAGNGVILVGMWIRRRFQKI